MPEELELTGSKLRRDGFVELSDGSRFSGTIFGHPRYTDGEVVFNTGMVGYVESLTDPSYRGQILTLTYPLIGSYGVPDIKQIKGRFESDRIQVRGLIVANYIERFSHREAALSLGDWLSDQGIVGIEGVDTRELTKILREKGTMLGRIVVDSPERDSGLPSPAEIEDPNAADLVGEVTCRETYSVAATDCRSISEHRSTDPPHIVVIDCGCKRSIIAGLLSAGCRVTVIPYNTDPNSIECDGVMISNGPGDPAMCFETIRNVATLITRSRAVPVAGICLGCQIIALAAGAKTYKLPYGHRSQNKPCRRVGTEQCLITSQNHGYAIDAESLPPDWELLYTNLDDGTVEGIRHRSKPIYAVQFHPEASPGPTDSRSFFTDFLEVVRHG